MFRNFIIGTVACFLTTVGALAQERTPPLPPGFNRPFVAAFNNNYLGLVEDNIPLAMADPANTHRYVFALIEQATSRLDVAFYDMSDGPAIDALIAAHRRGVAVRIITDTDNLRDKEDPTKMRETARKLRRAKVPLRDDRRGAFMHHKFIIADGGAVWLGSMNMTPTSIFEHNNNGLIIRSRRVVANFQAEFDRLFDEGTFSGVREPVPFPEARIGGATVRTYFSPRGGIREALLDEVRNATNSIRVMAFVFTDKYLSEALLERHQAGVTVEAVFDDCLIDSRSQYYTLRNAGIRARRDGNQALMHHKTMIFDERIVATGSYNFTVAAEQFNNESIVIVHSVELGEAYTAEFKRLMDATFQNRNIPPYDHPACRRGWRNN